ncbi:hypothetical protein FACS18949_10420 [Clostridia bacterium]|nr:hypothetical protein FACS18949_10420 [Clostridia bacterium]
MLSEQAITRENLNGYLKELAKDFRKLNGSKMPAEVILIGGAAVLANYGFREMTYDIDAIILASSAMKEAINSVGDRHGLPNGWFNADFKRTGSYSDKLYLYDHSGLTINTTGFPCPWDSGQIGWAYVSHTDIIKEYDCYLRGECYGFQLLENGMEIDSCYGFLGDFDDAKEAIKRYLPDNITQLAEHINYGDDDPEWDEEEEMEDEW